MLTSRKLLNLVAEQVNLGATGLAELLSITMQAIYDYRSGRRIMSDEIAARCSRLVGLPTPYVLACLNVERATKSNVRNAYIELAKLAEKAAETPKRRKGDRTARAAPVEPVSD